MSKLIITSTEEGKIKYIEGEEVEISLGFVKSRVTELDDMLSNMENTYLENTSKIKTELDSKIGERLSVYQEDCKRLGEAYENDIALLKEEARANLEAEEQTLSSRSSLEEERNKLKAILSRVEPIQEVKVTEPEFEPEQPKELSEEDTKLSKNKVINRIVF